MALDGCLLLDRLLAEGRECEWLEFKERSASPADIGCCLSALSNSALLVQQPYGYLVFGINDKTLEVVGTDFSVSKEKVGNEEIENWLATQLSPRVDFKTIEFVYDDKRVVAIRVEPARDIPIAFRGVEYVRVGSYTKKLKEHPEKERKIWLTSTAKDFASEIAQTSTNTDNTLTLLDYQRYFDLMEIATPLDQKPLLNRLQEESLVTVSPDNDLLKITNLGAVTFAKNLNNFDRLSRKTVRVIVYKGSGRLETLKEYEYSRGYASGFRDLVNYVDGMLPAREQISNGLRETLKPYPLLAIRELLANLLIHQDFTISGAGPMVEIFADRVEFSNPGKSLIDPLRFIDVSPKSRNEKLARLMRRVSICEERGSGIDKVISSVEEQHLPAPKFIDEQHSCRVILYAPRALRDTYSEDQIRACYQHCCLRYVLNEKMTNQTIRERFKIKDSNYSVASRIIAKTISANLIKAADTSNQSKRTARYVPFWA